MKVSPEHRQWVELVKKWQTHYWLLDWRLDIETADGQPADHTDSDPDCGAMASSQPEYKQALVTQYKEAMQKQDWDTKNAIACHEVAHVFWSELSVFIGDLIDHLPKSARPLVKALYEKENEKATTRLAQVMLRMEKLASKAVK